MSSLRGWSSEARGSVHQQQARPGEQRPAERDALLLAAGEAVRPALGQSIQTQQLDDLFEARAGVSVAPAAGALGAIEQIAPHREVREQTAFLKHVAEPALLRRQVDAGGAVEQRRAVDRDAPFVGRKRPASRLTSVVLPAPERPNSAITPAVSQRSSTSSAKPCRRFLAETSNIASGSLVAAEPARQELRADQRGEGRRRRRSPPGARRRPHRRDFVPGRRGLWAGSGSRREWPRRR